MSPVVVLILLDVLNKYSRKKMRDIGKEEKENQCLYMISAGHMEMELRWRNFCIMTQTNTQLDFTPYICLRTHYEI